MSELLGTFNENEFTVLKQKQSAPPTPKGKDGKPEPSQKPEGKPSDEKPEDAEKPKDESEVEEIPLKSKEEILADLEKAGVKSDSGEEQSVDDEQGEDKPFDIGDKKSDNGEPKEENGEPKDGKGEPKESGEPKDEIGEDKKGKGKSDKQGKIDEQEAKENERREIVKAKNYITTKINQYNEILIKHNDKLPSKVKKSLNKAIAELTEKRNSI